MDHPIRVYLENVLMIQMDSLVTAKPVISASYVILRLTPAKLVLLIIPVGMVLNVVINKIGN